MNWPALGIAALVSLSCGVTYWGLLKLRATETTGQRLERLSTRPHPLEEAELESPFLDRMVKPWLRKQIRAAGRIAPARNIERLSLKLARAGYPFGWTVLDFLGIRVLAGLFAAAGLGASRALGDASFLRSMLLIGAAGLFGFFLPDIWLTLRVRRRQKALTRALPDALDMLSICVDAGAGIDSAMLRLSQKWKNELAAEFGRVVAEIRVGVSRAASLLNMAERTGVPELSSFVAVLLQADQFGLSIANVLHTQSEQMRQRRWQLAEEEARKIPLKLLFPLVFMILPALFAVVIGPAVPVFIRLFTEIL